MTATRESRHSSVILPSLAVTRACRGAVARLTRKRYSGIRTNPRTGARSKPSRLYSGHNAGTTPIDGTTPPSRACKRHNHHHHSTHPAQWTGAEENWSNVPANNTDSAQQQRQQTTPTDKHPGLRGSRSHPHGTTPQPHGLGNQRQGATLNPTALHPLEAHPRRTAHGGGTPDPTGSRSP